MKDIKLLMSRIESLSSRLRPCTTASQRMGVVLKFLGPHMASMRPDNLLEEHPQVMLLKMIQKLAPEFLDDMARADLQAIVILCGETLFEGTELVDIIEGRRAERAITN